MIDNEIVVNVTDYKFKVHSAIYSCDASSSSITSAYDVTDNVQEILRDSKDGILHLDEIIIKKSNIDIAKCFAIVVTVVYPDGRAQTRFCSCPEGSVLDVKQSGVVCSF